MSFHHSHRLQVLETVEQVAKKYGYDNPGPVLAYPPNGWAAPPVDLTRVGSTLAPATTVLIPYHPDALRKIIATSDLLVVEVLRDAAALLKKNSGDKKAIDDFLMKIDAVNFIANMGVGVGSLAAKGPNATMDAAEALLWLAESRATVASNVATMAIPTPEAPRRDFRFWVRHALGPWNPSFWASVYTAVSEGDVDLYLYGTDVVAHRTRMRIKRQAEQDVARLRARASGARQQLAAPFYRVRV